MTQSAPTLPVTELLFLSVYHKLPGVSDGEQIDCYTPHDHERLRMRLCEHVGFYLTLFSESFEYEDYFSSADYGVQDDFFDDGELEIFRSAIDPEDRETALPELHPRDQFYGCRAVIDKRIQSTDIREWHQGLALFNGVMESALPAADSSNPRCYITLKSIKEFAPGYLDGLLYDIRIYEETSLRIAFSLASRKDVDGEPVTIGFDALIEQVKVHFALHRTLGHGDVMRSLKPLIEMLRLMITNPAWPENDIALGGFMLLFDYRQGVVDDAP
jgi:hypothetical protein